jgi:excinuclease ABC subunit A
MIRRLLDAGNTVVAVDHNLSIISSADYIIELGPEGGDDGGFLMYQGPVSPLLGRKDSITGRFLKNFQKNT